MMKGDDGSTEQNREHRQSEREKEKKSAVDLVGRDPPTRYKSGIE